MFLLPVALAGQNYELQMLSSSTPTNLRGISALSPNLVWVCGNNGHIGRTTNGGKEWKWITPDIYEKADFRDVFAFDENTAIVMASGTPALLLRTADGGETWQEVFKSTDSAVFLDALDFWDNQHGLCVGDWVNSHPYYLETKDQGATWTLVKHFEELEEQSIASFAASGTCMRTIIEEDEKLVLTAISQAGMTHGIVLASPDYEYDDYDFFEVPFGESTPSQGLFSLCIDSVEEVIWVVGGDYAKPNMGFCAYSGYNSSDFYLPPSQPSGYRSCVEQFMHNQTSMIIACGLNGVEISPSNPNNVEWKTVSKVPLNTAITSKQGNTVFLCGPQGTIYKLVEKK